MTRRWIWRRLTHNFGWKLASLALSVLLWFTVVDQPELVTIQSVPLLYRNLPHNLLLMSEAPGEIHAELRGPSGRLTRETLSEVIASVDLAGVTGPGTQTFTLSHSDFAVPQGVAFLRAVPSQVALRFDKIASKTVPVEIQLSGSLPAGYRLTGKTVEPETLNVSGPESRVHDITVAKTDLVELGGITHSTPVRVNAYVDESRAQFDSPPVVTVRLTVEKAD